MTKAMHTAGPWHTSSTHLGNAYDIGAENGANIAIVSGPADNGADEFRANARLIAAAPELVAALDYIQTHSNEKAIREKAASALSQTGVDHDCK